MEKKPSSQKMHPEALHPGSITKKGYYTHLTQLRIELKAFLRKNDSDILWAIFQFKKELNVKQVDSTIYTFIHLWLTYEACNQENGLILTEAQLPTWSFQGFNQLHSYGDVVCHQILGDHYAPFLCTVKVQGMYDDIDTQILNLPLVKIH